MYRHHILYRTTIIYQVEDWASTDMVVNPAPGQLRTVVTLQWSTFWVLEAHGEIGKLVLHASHNLIR